VSADLEIRQFIGAEQASIECAKSICDYNFWRQTFDDAFHHPRSAQHMTPLDRHYMLCLLDEVALAPFLRECASQADSRRVFRSRTCDLRF